MDKAQLDVLEALAGLKFRKKQAELAVLLKREGNIRQELENLATLLTDSNKRVAEHAQAQSVGVDLLWRNWVGQNQVGLNMELSRILASKEGHIAATRLAFGRTQAIEELQRQRVEKRVKKLQKW